MAIAKKTAGKTMNLNNNNTNKKFVGVQFETPHRVFVGKGGWIFVN